jgi:hypothetical protein
VGVQQLMLAQDEGFHDVQYCRTLSDAVEQASSKSKIVIGVMREDPTKPGHMVFIVPNEKDPENPHVYDGNKINMLLVLEMRAQDGSLNLGNEDKNLDLRLWLTEQYKPLEYYRKAAKYYQDHEGQPGALDKFVSIKERLGDDAVVGVDRMIKDYRKSGNLLTISYDRSMLAKVPASEPNPKNKVMWYAIPGDPEALRKAVEEFKPDPNNKNLNCNKLFTEVAKKALPRELPWLVNQIFYYLLDRKKSFGHEQAQEQEKSLGGTWAVHTGEELAKYMPDKAIFNKVLDASDPYLQDFASFATNQFKAQFAPEDYEKSFQDNLSLWSLSGSIVGTMVSSWFDQPQICPVCGGTGNLRSRYESLRNQALSALDQDLAKIPQLQSDIQSQPDFYYAYDSRGVRYIASDNRPNKQQQRQWLEEAKQEGIRFRALIESLDFRCPVCGGTGRIQGSIK